MRRGLLALGLAEFRPGTTPASFGDMCSPARGRSWSSI